MKSERETAGCPPLDSHARLLLVAALTCSLISASFVFAQQNRPNIANEVEGTKSAPSAGAKSSAETRRNPRHARGATSGAARTPSAAPTTTARPNAAVLLPVSFLTGLSGAEIFLERSDTTLQKLGRTDNNGRLSTRLLRGFYQLVIARPDIGMRRQQIEVRPGNTTFNFTVAPSVAASAASAKTNAPTSAAQVIERFVNPKTTDELTLSDWETAQALAATAYAENPVEPQLQAQALFAEGQLAFLRRDYATALRAFNNAALILPDSPVAFYALGNAHLANAQVGEAARAYQRAIELNPQLALAHKGLADVLARQGKHKEAIGYYERARALGYASMETSLSLARALAKQRRWQQALKELQEISRTRPSSEVYLLTGDCFVGLNQPLSAAPAYRRAAELDPTSALAHYKLGSLVYSLREYREAAEALERALALDPTGKFIDRARAREMSNSAADKLRKVK